MKEDFQIKTSKFLFIIVIGVCLLGCHHSKTSSQSYSNSDLTFLVGNDTKVIHQSSSLATLAKIEIIEIFDTEYKKEKRYKAMSFSSLLNHIFSQELKQDTFTSLIFTATDGYEAVIDLKKNQM